VELFDEGIIKNTMAIWNQRICKLTGGSEIICLRGHRLRTLKLRLNEDPEFWDGIIAAAKEIRPWVREQGFMDFDWLLKRENHLHLIEGRYRHRRKVGARASGFRNGGGKFSGEAYG
jgi:hypothetical protein